MVYWLACSLIMRVVQGSIPGEGADIMIYEFSIFSLEIGVYRELNPNTHAW